MKLKDFTKAERSLLLYLETCAVDNFGLIDMRKMNAEDMAIANRWDELKFVRYGRIAFESIKSFSKPYMHWCELGELAWQLAHEERKARAARMLKKRTWTRTEELRDAAPA
jgi:hypothetical protein